MNIDQIDIRQRIITDILETHNYNLPLAVADYFLWTFKPHVVSPLRVHGPLIERFIKYKRKTRVNFEPVKVNDIPNGKVRLVSVTITKLHEDHYEEFIQANPEFSGMMFDLDVRDSVLDDDFDVYDVRGVGLMRYRASETQYLDVTIKLPKPRPQY